jgi:hypothetical protein
MRKYFLIILFTYSCNNPSEVIVYQGVRFRCKENCKLINKDGYEGSIGSLILGNDTFTLEKSIYANQLFEKNPIVDFPRVAKDSPIDLSIMFSNHPNEEYNQALYMKHYFIVDSSNGLRKIMKQPKVISTGTTGVFIREIDGKNNFSMYSNNLSLDAQIKAVEMFKSISFDKNYQLKK